MWKRLVLALIAMLLAALALASEPALGATTEVTPEVLHTPTRLAG